MFARILKAGLLVLAVIAAFSFALPVSAADWRGGGRGFHSRVFPGSFHGSFAGNRNGFHRNFDPGRRFQFADRGRFGRGGFQDRRNGFRNRGVFGNNGFAWNNRGWNNRGWNKGFGWNNRGWNNRGWWANRRVGPNHLMTLSSSSGVITNRGSGVVVILSDRADTDLISNNYAGSNDVYRADGGTYVTGYGYAGGGPDQVTDPHPGAKIIDTARAGDPCSHENGVCVIRAR